MPKIERLPSGTYRVRVYVGKDEHGKDIIRSITHQDKARLRVMAEELRAKKGGYRAGRSVEDCLNGFLSSKMPSISPSTLRSYTCMATTLKRDYRAFCALLVQKITKSDVQSVLDSMLGKGKTVKTVRNYHALLSAVFKHYELDFPTVSLPAKVRPNVYEPTQADIQKTIQAAKGTRLEVPVWLAIHGLRRGEICSLAWPDDFEGNIAHVHKSKVYVGNNTNIDKATKNYTSDRRVPISWSVIELIRQQGFVTDYTPGALSDEFPDFLARNGINKYRFHDLRHFFVAFMHEQGFSDAQIMKLGGWKTDSVMKRSYRYALSDPEMNEKAVFAISKLDMKT